MDVSGCLITQLSLTETRDVEKMNLFFLYAFLQFWLRYADAQKLYVHEVMERGESIF